MSWHTRAFVDQFSDSERERPDNVRALYAPPQPSPSSRGVVSRIVAALRPPDPLASVASELVSRLGLRRSRTREDGHDWDMAALRILPSLQALRRSAPVFRLAVVRTWANAWVTSARSHAGRDLCVAGCAAPDGVLHYMSCHVIRAEVELATDHSCAPDLVGRLAIAAEKGPGAHPKISRFRPPDVATMQLAIVCDAVHKLRQDAAPRRPIRARVRDAARRHCL